MTLFMSYRFKLIGTNQNYFVANIKKCTAMFIKRKEDENLQPKGNEDSVQLQQMLTSCMVNRQILCCIAGVLIGIPISIQQKSNKPFAILGVLGSFVDYSIPYTADCRMIHNAMKLSLQKELLKKELKP
ncbi:unnamed protein product [Peronospora belbahrii]|uniref:MICOS complex subunit n=1 Tax=Peronospora belbahrii TaxID=622444 RepID=A0AAU9L727_9STRA|nr:unnamed protein product [Peronospora belbahrii]CAH0522154.1 unnamed protein product [Peronospora belbahrii]